MGNSLIARAEHRLYLEIKKKKLKNKTPSVIASNCNGGVVLHDLGARFNTPTVNLFFTAKDFLKFVSNLDHYLSIELVKIKDMESYPIGQLDDIQIHFVHYGSFSEAKEKWEERKLRIDRNNLFIMMTDRDGCTYEDIKTFDSLPFKNKVIFTHKPYPEFRSVVYLKGFEKDGEVGILSEWKKGLLKRRYLDDFDYVAFFNEQRRPQ